MRCENEINYMEVTITGDYPSLEEWIKAQGMPNEFDVQYVYRCEHGEDINEVDCKETKGE